HFAETSEKGEVHAALRIAYFAGGDPHRFEASKGVHQQQYRERKGAVARSTGDQQPLRIDEEDAHRDEKYQWRYLADREQIAGCGCVAHAKEVDDGKRNGKCRYHQSAPCSSIERGKKLTRVVDQQIGVGDK